MNKKEALKKIEEAHPRYEDIMMLPIFQKWFDSIDDEIRELGFSSDPTDAITLLDLFDEYMAETSTKH